MFRYQKYLIFGVTKPILRLKRSSAADSETRALVSIQLNGRVDGGKKCRKPSKRRVYQIAGFQVGKDIMVPPSSEQEDGVCNMVPPRFLKSYSPYSADWQSRNGEFNYKRNYVRSVGSDFVRPICTYMYG